MNRLADPCINRRLGHCRSGRLVSSPQLCTAVRDPCERALRWSAWPAGLKYLWLAGLRLDAKRLLRCCGGLYAGVALALFIVSSLAGCAGGAGDVADLLHVSCLQEPQRGRCSQPRSAFYYDYQSDSCRPFKQGVCDPDWPFQSLRDCIQACGGRPSP